MTLPIGLTATAVGALRDRIRSWLPTPEVAGGVQVYDGPDPSRAFVPRAVTVAEAFQDDQEAVLVERAESGARPSVTTTMTVSCSVYAGGGDVKVDYRATAGSILAAIETGLSADRTLGGVVSLARLGSAQWVQGRDTKGAGAMIGFTIELVTLS